MVRVGVHTVHASVLRHGACVQLGLNLCALGFCCLCRTHDPATRLAAAVFYFSHIMSALWITIGIANIEADTVRQRRGRVQLICRSSHTFFCPTCSYLLPAALMDGPGQRPLDADDGAVQRRDVLHHYNSVQRWCVAWRTNGRL